MIFPWMSDWQCSCGENDVDFMRAIGWASLLCRERVKLSRLCQREEDIEEGSRNEFVYGVRLWPPISHDLRRRSVG